LIEALIVIGIIALLASIMIPVLQRSRQSARTVHCSSNLGQLMRGWYVALADRDDRVPLTIGLPSPGKPMWHTVLRETLATPSIPPGTGRPRSGVMLCPAIERAFEGPAYPNDAVGYAVNSRFRPGQPAGDNQGVVWSAIGRPSRYPWLLDPFIVVASPVNWSPRSYFGAVPTDQWNIGYYHPAQRTAVAFADSHVQLVDALATDGPTDASGTPHWLLDGP
jgi:hypothetical protein